MKKVSLVIATLAIFVWPWPFGAHAAPVYRHVTVGTHTVPHK